MDMDIDRKRIHELIVPIFKTGKDTNDISKYVYLGTGFMLRDNILLTCWHCIKDIKIKEDEQISAVIVKEDGSDHKVFQLGHYEQDLNKTDICVMAHPFKASEYLLKLPKNIDYPFGTTIWTYGYPETTKIYGKDKLLVPPQFFRGYITRTLEFKGYEEFKDIASYEINIPFPKGLSGAPICTEQMEVIGIVYGTNDIATIEEYSESKKEDGNVELVYEKQRIQSYGLAHHTTTILNIKSNIFESGKFLNINI